MTFWTVFAAAALAQVIGGILGVTLGFVAGVIKNRKNRRNMEREIKRELRVAADEQPARPVGMAEYVTAPPGEPATGLKPCPFCGHSELCMSRFDPRPGGPPRTEFAVFCYTCGATGPALAQPERAEDVWNGAPRTEPGVGRF